MNDNAPIPFLDLVAPHAELKEEIFTVFSTAVETGGFVGGPMVENFERDFAKYCDTEYCVGVASGTEALMFALLASGVRKGEIVLTVPNTFIATAEAISQVGGRPDFIDIDEQTYNMDVIKLKEYLETQCHWDKAQGRLMHRRLAKRVAAIVPVHLYGQPAQMDPILALARQYNLIVIEDSCQAHGASYFSAETKAWKRTGSLGKAAAFSFYPGKNLGACGEGGAVTTNDAAIAKKIRMLRDHGQSQKYFHDIEGFNGRLDSIQAGILGAKLSRLEEWNERRRQAAQRYQEIFREFEGDFALPHTPRWAKPVFHLYVIRVQDREELQRYLTSKKIGTGIHYPVPLHLQRAYHDLGYEAGAFPIAEKIASELLSLPMFPQITKEQQRRVVDTITAFSSKKKREKAATSGRYLVVAG